MGRHWGGRISPARTTEARERHVGSAAPGNTALSSKRATRGSTELWSPSWHKILVLETSSSAASSEGLAGQFDEKTRKWGFIGPAGNFVINPQFDAVGSFNSGAAWAAFPDRREWCLIDKMGHVKLGTECQCDQPLGLAAPTPRQRLLRLRPWPCSRHSCDPRNGELTRDCLGATWGDLDPRRFVLV